ncbi:MAG: hypothetical protein RL007_919 [Bacteroidota bacterium]|jgi:glycosyltransferase involved in cell wall biosynthesis
MKICYLADGGSIHTKRWCNHFAGLGHEVHLITFNKSDIAGIQIHFIDAGSLSTGGGNWRVLLQTRKVKKILAQIKPDILHAQYATSYGTVGALSGFHPYVITALGSDVLISPYQSKLYKWLLQYSLGKADWITAMADHMRDAMIGFLKTDARKVETVMFGIDPSIFNDQTRALPSGKFVITSTRNFEPVYNHKLLFDAMQILRDSIPGIELNMIGAGSREQEVRSWYTNAGMNDFVHFKGRMPQVQIAEHLRSSHVFVSTSLSDGNNVSLNEAMACGCVSVVTDIPANRQWMKDGVNGYLVPVDDAKKFADKILYIYTNYASLQESSGRYNAPLIAEKALWNVNMDRVAAKYSELTGKK